MTIDRLRATLADRFRIERELGSDFIQTAVSRRNYDVAADDQRFLMVQRADGAKRGQIVVVENWGEEIRRKTRQP